MQEQSLSPDFFDDMYQKNSDPWNFKKSEYEAQKYTATIAALPRPRYRSGFEIGCSIGVLTEKLAQKSEKLLAVDITERALEQARERCQNLPQVRFANLFVPETYPNEKFDLTMLSEVGYFWSRQDLTKAYYLIAEHLEPGGHLLMVHWTPFVPEFPRTGDEVHDTFLKLAQTDKQMRHLAGRREERYRLDLLQRN